mmetsp:Transcript_54769/g.102666  ORF Transcript_54769/g.102666 Transcript_54769/m.102666 type:complete len:714 (-) Transcript_54769:166-2307(-)
MAPRQRAVRNGKDVKGANGNADLEVWVVADPRSARFGQVFEDSQALADGVRRGSSCLVTTEEGVILLEHVQSHAEFLESYQARAESAGFVKHLKEKPQVLAQALDFSSRQWQRLSQLGQTDMFALRPDLVKRRIFLGMALFSVYIYSVAFRHYSDRPPSVAFLFIFTLTYPILLWLFAQLMRRRARPVQTYVFELLLVLDVYQLVSSVVIFLAILHEALNLHLLVPPWGNPASRSSPYMRKLLWLHYHNRMIELLDTVIRMSQKKFKAYGALHVYIRLVLLWGWLFNCRVGGGDAYFLTLLDAAVTAVRFFVFTLSILRWNWNFHYDFGLNAPKIAIFRKEHLHQLQIVEFAVLAVHGLCCGYWNTMSRWLAVFEVLVMVNGMSIFTDFYFSQESTSATRKHTEDTRLTFSFDSSCWLFIYHFGVAKWMQDNVNVTVEDFAFSGSSGGALVAATLACPIDAEEVKDLTVKGFAKCKTNPFYMFRLGEEVLDHYLRDTRLHVRCSGHLRVLLTKVAPTPPLLGAEVASTFSSWQDLFSCLRASMHVPFAAGVLPYPIPGRGWFFDGLVWAALFVPWRAFADDDVIVRVSACSFPNAQIGPRVPFPPWWLIFPPSMAALDAMYWMGYRDAQEYFLEDTPHLRCSCERRKNEKAVPRQVQELRKHLRTDPHNRFDEEAARKLADLQASVAWHWKVGFCVLAAVSTLVPLVVVLLLH